MHLGELHLIDVLISHLDAMQGSGSNMSYIQQELVTWWDTTTKADIITATVPLLVQCKVRQNKLPLL